MSLDAQHRDPALQRPAPGSQCARHAAPVASEGRPTLPTLPSAPRRLIQEARPRQQRPIATPKPCPALFDITRSESGSSVHPTGTQQVPRTLLADPLAPPSAALRPDDVLRAVNSGHAATLAKLDAVIEAQTAQAIDLANMADRAERLEMVVEATRSSTIALVPPDVVRVTGPVISKWFTVRLIPTRSYRRTTPRGPFWRLVAIRAAHGRMSCHITGGRASQIVLGPRPERCTQARHLACLRRSPRDPRAAPRRRPRRTTTSISCGATRSPLHGREHQGRPPAISDASNSHSNSRYDASHAVTWSAATGPASGGVATVCRRSSFPRATCAAAPILAGRLLAAVPQGATHGGTCAPAYDGDAHPPRHRRQC